jgi:Zn-dependent protease
MNLWWQDWSAAMGPAFVLAWAFWVIFSICLHELGHGWAAIRCGDRTPIMLGHMTWNPIVHMGFPSLIMLFFLGIAWGMMPVNPANFRKIRDEATVALAGPAMNLLLAVVCLLVGAFAFAKSGAPTLRDAWEARTAMGLLATFCWLGLFLNLALFALNLLPLPPLDGSRVVATFVRPYREFVYSERGAITAFVGLAIVFFLAGRWIFDLAGTASAWAFIRLAGLFA